MRRARSLFAVLAIAATVLAGSSDPDGWGPSSTGSAVDPSSARYSTPALDALDGRRWAATKQPGGIRWSEASRLAGRRWDTAGAIEGRRWETARVIDGIRWPAG